MDILHANGTTCLLGTLRLKLKNWPLGSVVSPMAHFDIGSYFGSLSVSISVSSAGAAADVVLLLLVVLDLPLLKPLLFIFICLPLLPSLIPSFDQDLSLYYGDLYFEPLS